MERELGRPYVQWGVGGYKRAWRVRLGHPGEMCRGGMPEPPMPQFNIVGRIAAPSPSVSERFYRAAVATELTNIVHETRRRGTLPRVGIRSAVCADVVWVLETRGEHGSVRPDRDLKAENDAARRVALRFEWLRPR